MEGMSNGQGSATRAGPAFAALVFTTALVNPLAMTALVSVLPAISAHFSATANAAALVRGLVTVVSVALVVGAPVAGHLIERTGVRPILLCAILVFTLSGLSGLFIDNLWLLLVSRLLLGLADAIIGTLTVALIVARLDRAARNRWIGWFTFASAVGALVFIPLSGVIARTGWRNIFLLYGVGLAILVCAAIVVKREALPQRPAARPGTPRGGGPLPISLIALGVASGAIENTTHLFLPFKLAQMGETTPSRIGLAVLPIAVGGAASAFLYGQVRTRLSIRWTFVAAFSVGAAALIWLGLSGSYGMIVLAATSLGLGVGLLAPNINAYAAALGEPALRARYIGLARGAFFAGAPIAQLLLEPVAAAFGASMAIVVLGCASVALTLWLACRRQDLMRTADQAFEP